MRIEGWGVILSGFILNFHIEFLEDARPRVFLGVFPPDSVSDL